MIRIENVSVQFEQRRALADINLTLGEKRIGIVGANGSGKSTFVRLLNGLQTATSGRVLVDDLDAAKDGRKLRRHVGFVFQNPDNQIVYPVVEEDIAFGLKPLKLPKEEINRRIDEVLARYDLQDFKAHPSHLLSGGQKQLLAISGVLVMEPRGKDTYLCVQPPPEFMDYVVFKGSIAIDGVSLTLAEVEADRLAIWLIPYTLQVTNLAERRVGDPVNLEFDMLAKHVKELLGKQSLPGIDRQGEDS